MKLKEWGGKVEESREEDGVCNTPKSDSYTWSEAERLVDRIQPPRVDNMRDRKEGDTESTDSTETTDKKIRVSFCEGNFPNQSEMFCARTKSQIVLSVSSVVSVSSVFKLLRRIGILLKVHSPFLSVALFEGSEMFCFVSQGSLRSPWATRFRPFGALLSSMFPTFHLST